MKTLFSPAGIFPIIDSVKNYRKEHFIKDLTAGLSTAVILIPNGIAVSTIAGLPPVMGLYSAIAGSFIYPFFGTSGQLMVGPSSVLAILMVSLAKPLFSESESYISSAIFLSLITGIILLLMGMFRLGFIDNFLSHSVINGFITASAIIIIGSQIESFTGIKINHYEHEIVLITYYKAITDIDKIHLLTFLTGLFTVIFIYTLKKINRLIPGALLSIIITMFFVYYFGLDERGLHILGNIEFIIPSLKLPVVPEKISVFQNLFSISFTIVIIGFAESISLARDMAARTRQNIDANQELKALGITNIVASFLSCFPVAGGMAPSAINFSAGARTVFASIFASFIVFVGSLFFAPCLYYTPVSCLGGIIIVAMAFLIDINGCRHMFKVNRSDGITFIITFLVTLFIGVERGLLLGVIISLAMYIYRTALPQVVVLGRGRDGEEDIYKDAEKYDVETIPYISILRVDGSLYFINAKYVGKRINKILRKDKNIKYIVLDGGSINHIDYTAERELRKVAENIKNHGSSLFITSLKNPVSEVFKRSGFYEFLGPDHFFETKGQAVKYLQHLYETKPLERENPRKTVLMRLTSFLKASDREIPWP